ncbi:hypothetical protein Mal4_16150 [Maioricimonas rarisocia]|uniref:Uncharacterized protein n=1 Tax=Maioricimonas rarisocia TaxID=2528026 RepID=A0A517Z4E5_9PLAN|nr:hypothetical protein [Maioricimonas rarisocia]QDU37305.1 hypothetical protein Mal4_16150 [Maioricimonas rarisocia]
MQLRFHPRTCIAGILSLVVPTLSTVAMGQQPQRVAAAVARPQETDEPVDPRLDQLLKEWEAKTAGIQKLRGSFERYEYDSVFLVEKRAVGKFWYQAPDLGRMDFEPGEVPPGGVNPEMKGPNGEPYEVKAEVPQQWVCTGQEILSIDESQKTYNRIAIPPAMQGDNIVHSPLPFLFGMKAEAAKQRYKLELGVMHNPDGSIEGKPQRIHVVARPKMQIDKREWSRAEILLHHKFFVPEAIQLKDPTGNKTTTYVFPLKGMHGNERLPWIPSPFSVRLDKYQLIQDVTAAPQQGTTTR